MSIVKPAIKIAALTLVVMCMVGVMFGLTIAQETPAGTVKGRVVDEQGNPMAHVRISLTLSEDYDNTIRGTSDDQGYFIITDVPEGKYTGYASARGYESANLSRYIPFQVKEGKTTRLSDAVMYPRPPSIYGNIASAFTPDEDVVLSLNGYSRKERTTVQIDVYRFDFAAAIRESGGSAEGDAEAWESYGKKLGKPVYQRTLDVRTDSEGYFTRRVPLRVSELGGYIVHVELESTEALYRTLVTDLGLVTKRAPGKTVVYAVSYTKKHPLAGVDLEFYGDQDKPSIKGKTDANGLFTTNGIRDESLSVLGSIDGSYALVSAYSSDQDEKTKGYIYTDRPIYRPGHTVMFKGIMRTSEPGRLLPVVGKSLSVEVKDGEDTTIKRLNVTTNRFGSFDGKIDLDPDAKPGHYSIEAEYAGETSSASFSVEEYRKPEFKASVSFAKPRYVGGESIESTVEASYYFGGPVANAMVTYTIYKAPDYFYYYPDDVEDTSFYEDLYSDGDDGEYDYGGYGEVVLEGEGATDSTGVLKIRIPTKSIKSEERYSVEATVTDASGRSIDVSGGVMLTPGTFALAVNTDRYFYKPNTNISANVYSVDYDRKLVPNVDASLAVFYLNSDGKRGQQILERRVHTDSHGHSQVSFSVADQGSFEIVVTAQDQSGNHIEKSADLYVADDEWVGEDNYEPPALNITVDKKIYHMGDTARVMINSPVKDSYVLITIEGRRLFKQQVVHLTAATKIVEVPLLDEYAPNVYASATLINGKKLATGEAPIPISPEGKFINVQIHSDKSRYLPGENATYTINTTDAAGRGVPAEVSLGVVDESIYAIREDTTQDIRRFFHGPVTNMVSTSFSYSDYYYGGEDKFQGKVRKYFPDTAYWNPSIVTDENGVASVTFRMPDNLTSWRATARAVTQGTAVGSAEQNVTVRKNILVRLQAPRFFRQRDQLTISSVVHNYTDKDQNMKVWLVANGIRIDGQLARTQTLTSNGSAVFTWNGTADKVGTATLRVYAQGQGDQDAMELQTPVIAHGVPEIVTGAGNTKGSTEFVLNVPGNIVTDASELKMGFSSSLAGAALGITDAIGDYQMESPEGIMDVLLPNVVMYQAMEMLGSRSPVRLAKIKKLVKHDLKLVYDWQLPGGGWGWSEYGEKDPWMTAYVVYGLIRAKQAGISINQDALNRGIKATIESLPDAGDLGKRSTMIYVLALAGQAKPEWIDMVLKDKKLQNYSLSLMILSLNEMGEQDKARSLVPKLVSGAAQTTLQCSWPETFPWGFYSCNSYETTAYAIRALLAVDPQNPAIEKGVRWLVNRRKGDRYDANYDTASVVYALADYLQVRTAETPDYTAKIYLNGQMVRELTMGPESIYQPEVTVSLTGSAITAGRNAVRIEKTGSGDLYYWANLKYYSSGEDVPARVFRNGDVSIRRDYYRLKLVHDRKEGLVYKPFPLGDTANVGELVRCRLVLQASKDFRYLIVEDMLPSGCEVVERYRPTGYGYEDYSWDYWWGGETVYDNRIVFQVDNVYKGKRVIEYDFRPEIRGSFHVMPTTAQGAYEPEIFAHSAEGRLTVE